jgi:hypothetical protein
MEDRLSLPTDAIHQVHVKVGDRQPVRVPLAGNLAFAAQLFCLAFPPRILLRKPRSVFRFFEGMPSSFLFQVTVIWAHALSDRNRPWVGPHVTSYFGLALSAISPPGQPEVLSRAQLSSERFVILAICLVL